MTKISDSESESESFKRNYEFRQDYQLLPELVMGSHIRLDLVEQTWTNTQNFSPETIQNFINFLPLQKEDWQPPLKEKTQTIEPKQFSFGQTCVAAIVEHHLQHKKPFRIIVEGSPGTGKTTIINYLKSKYEEKLWCMAPTGIAAILTGGMTTYSTLKLPVKKKYKRPLFPDELAELQLKLENVSVSLRILKKKIVY